MPDHVYFMLIWVSFWNLLFCYVFYLFYEAANGAEFVKELRYMFWSQKRYFFTPFFFLGILCGLNYLLVALANPHVQAIYQVIASILQLPFVILFNYIINGEKIYTKHDSALLQIGKIILVFVFFFSGLCLVSYSEFESKFENVGWFICYLASTVPLPLLSVMFQALFGTKHTYKQEDYQVYKKPSLAIMMMNFWLLIWLVITIGIIPTVDGGSVQYSFSTGFACLFQQTSVDAKDQYCEQAYMIINFLTFCVIFNFYAGMKVIQFEDANIAILVSGTTPCLTL
jgi:hypothetical protein